MLGYTAEVNSNPPRTAVIAGATGLVGRCLLQHLLGEPRYARIVAVGRHAPPAHPKLEAIVDALHAPAQLGSRLAGDDCYCCLGATQRAAGSRSAFERVDFQMVVDFARAAHAAGCRRMIAVSALGASPHSPSFYSRVKGRAEQALAEIGFDSLQILRPSLLLGARSERRPAEAAAQRLTAPLAGLFVGPLQSLRPVDADTVAAAMPELAFRGAPGVHVLTYPFKP